MNRKSKVLMIEDDELFRRSTATLLGDVFQVTTAESIAAGQQSLEAIAPDVVLLDMMLPDGTGMDFLRWLGERSEHPPVIVLTAVDKIPAVVEAMREGAFDYLTKPPRYEEVQLAIERALKTSEIRHEVEQRRNLQLADNRQYQLLGEHPSMVKVREQIAIVGPTDATVLIEGETGTGKELVARGIHAASTRASGPFVPINCGAIPKDLFESEFFGHRRGAFTGADDAAVGKLRLAHKGTLLLDEVGELPLGVQVKLLRALEEQQFYPVGGSELVQVDTRVLASTHRDLLAMVQEGSFREDLYFRLNVYSIPLPPLRQRGDDVLRLAERFLERFNRKFQKSFQGFDGEAETWLRSHPWNGNVRELRNVVERVVLSETGDQIVAEHLDMLRPRRSKAVGEGVDLPAEGLDFEQLERQLLQRALEMSGGNKAQAARLLKMSPPTFYYRIDKFGLTPGGSGSD